MAIEAFPRSMFHRHDKDCRVPLDTPFAPLSDKDGRSGNFGYYYRVATDGRVYATLNDYYALEGCSTLRIPIFLGRTPADLT